MKVMTRVTVTALAILLVAPAFKVRFDLSNLMVYFLPFGLFLGSVILANALDVRQFGTRLAHGAVFLLLLAGPTMATVLDGGRESALFITIAMNCLLAMAVVMFPWTVSSLHQLLQAFAVFGAILAVHTILFFGSDEAVRQIQIEAGADYALATSYLNVSFAMGIGVLSATYFVVKGFSPVSLLIFAVNWLGLAMGRGRGAFLFCVLIAFIYLYVVLRGRVAGFTRRKKVISVVLIVSFIPVVFAQVMKIERMRYGLHQILFNLDVEAKRGGRGELAGIAMDKIRNAPLFGNGLGEYFDVGFGHPHNLFLTYGVDSGMIGIVLMVLFFGILARRVWSSLKLSNEGTVNLVYVTTALFGFLFLNYMKSGDPYLDRAFWIMCALPFACHLALLHSTGLLKARRLAFGRRTGGRELTPDVLL